MAGFPMATKCKQCGKEFSEDNPKYQTSASCVKCAKINNKLKGQGMDREDYKLFRESRGDGYYEGLAEELHQLQSREEWLNMIGIRLEKILNELGHAD